MENLTSIEVLAKTTEENLRLKNTEFLAKYPTRDDQIDYYTKLAMKVFEEFQIDGTFTEDGTRKNVEVWFDNKTPQMELFRKHPYWNEEAKAIVFTHNEAREVDYNTASYRLGDMLCYAYNRLNDDGYDEFLLEVYEALRYRDDNVPTLTDGFVASIRNAYKNKDREFSKDIDRMLKKGTKITKIVRKACTQYHQRKGDKIVDVTTLEDAHEEGNRNYESFEKLYAKFADALSDLTIKKVTMVSLHFCDFLLMSNGNSWSSCHYINSHNLYHEYGSSTYSGCYKQGCLSYALDKPSFIFYTLPNSYDGEEYYKEQKINRMCCQYKDGIIITGKCYPNNESAYITRYRQTLQYIISGLENVPNSWTFSRSTDRIRAFSKTDGYSSHYRDYEHPEQKPTVSICKHIGMDPDDPIVIGHQAYCVHCGIRLGNGSAAQWLQCSSHRVNPICHRCGRYIEDERDRVEDNGHIYCRDCCFYCDYHPQYESTDDGIHELEMEDGRIVKVCNDAMEYYVVCAECNKWVYYTSVHTIDGLSYCKPCFLNIVRAKTHNKKIRIVPQSDYFVGDYVLVVDNLEHCSVGTNDDMQTNYACRIAKVTDTGSWYGITIYPDGYSRWSWSSDCFVGKIVCDEIDDSMLGKYIWEV